MKKTKLYCYFIISSYEAIISSFIRTEVTQLSTEIVDQANNQPKKIHIPPNSHIFKLVIPGWKAARHHILNPHFDREENWQLSKSNTRTTKTRYTPTILLLEGSATKQRIRPVGQTVTKNSLNQNKPHSQRWSTYMSIDLANTEITQPMFMETYRTVSDYPNRNDISQKYQNNYAKSLMQFRYRQWMQRSKHIEG